jgi:hypothetical protein
MFTSKLYLRQELRRSEQLLWILGLGATTLLLNNKSDLLMRKHLTTNYCA